MTSPTRDSIYPSGTRSQNKPFFPKLLLVVILYHNRKVDDTGPGTSTTKMTILGWRFMMAMSMGIMKLDIELYVTGRVKSP